MDTLTTRIPSRVLIIDDNPTIHGDIRKILCPRRADTEMLDLAEALFGEPEAAVQQDSFRMDSALQGQEGLAMVERALAENDPYSLAFVDVRMPPGWDGIETIRQIWKVYPELQVVICTAYSDRSWGEIVNTVGHSDGLLILKKPFDNVEVLQLAHALTRKWTLARELKHGSHGPHASGPAAGQCSEWNSLFRTIHECATRELARPNLDPALVESLRQIKAAAEKGRKTQ